jgi:hypothetical protein
VGGCHAGCRELVGEFAAGGAYAPPQTHFGARWNAYRATSTRTCGPIVQTLSAPTPALPMRAKPCARWLHAMAKYALEELSNTVLAAEYRTTLPHDRLLAEEIAQTRRQLNLQRQNAFRALPRRRRARPSRSRRAFRQGHHLIAEGGRRLGGGVTNYRRGTSQPAPLDFEESSS